MIGPITDPKGFPCPSAARGLTHRSRLHRVGRVNFLIWRFANALLMDWTSRPCDGFIGFIRSIGADIIPGRMVLWGKDFVVFGIRNVLVILVNWLLFCFGSDPMSQYGVCYKNLYKNQTSYKISVQYHIDK